MVIYVCVFVLELVSGVQMFGVFHWCRYLVVVGWVFHFLVVLSPSGSYPSAVSVESLGSSQVWCMWVVESSSAGLQGLMMGRRWAREEAERGGAGQLEGPWVCTKRENPWRSGVG